MPDTIGTVVRYTLDTVSVPRDAVGKIVRHDTGRSEWPVVYFPYVSGPYSEFAVPPRHLDAVDPLTLPTRVRDALGV